MCGKKVPADPTSLAHAVALLVKLGHFRFMLSDKLTKPKKLRHIFIVHGFKKCETHSQFFSHTAAQE